MRNNAPALSEWFAADLATRAAWLAACLERIKIDDAAIRAWVQVAPQEATGEGPLSGIPFGVKDIIETRGLATEYGSSLYQGRLGTFDAAIVAELRSRGAILLGKTQTTAFAFRDPAPTRNPWNPMHTPGGSSSGSAAAVAAGMVPFALGTQTSGSVLRPASYCGVTGFKPTYGLLPMEGVLPYAKSFDTLGFFTRTPADMLLLWQALGRAAGRDEDFVIGVPEPMLEVEPGMAGAFQDAVASSRAKGLSTRPLDLSAMLKRLFDAQDTVALYEGARFHRERYEEHGERMEPQISDLVRQGLKIADAGYEAAARSISEDRILAARLFEETPVILVPAATGPAPPGLSYTGDASMNSPWTALGTPAISIPMAAPEGLPLGLQLVAAHNQDARLLRAATRIWNG